VTIQVTAITTGSYTNTLTVLIPATTTNNGSTTATAPGTVTTAPANMSASFASFPASAPVNTVVNGTANFVNISTTASSTATTAVFTLQLPIGLSVANVTVTSVLLGNGTYTPATGIVTFPSAPTVVNVTPSGTVSASISFLQTTTGVQGTGTTGATNDTVAANNTATFSVAASAADMSASFAGFPASAPVNTVVNGTANFVNINTTASSTATTAVFTLKLPIGLQTANVTVTSVLLGTGVYSSVTGIVTFATATLASVTPGATVSASISFLQTTTGVAGTGTTGAINDTSAANNTATFSVAASAADMSASFAGFPANASAGTTVTGTVSFANISTTPNSTATSVTVTLKLKPGLPTGSVTVTSVILGVGVYNSVTGVVTFPTSAPNVTPGQTITASITFIQTSTGVVGTATATAVNDTNASNNTTTFSVLAGNNATLSGRVFLDAKRNKIYDAGVDIPVTNFRAEVFKVTGTTTVVFGSALTDANGVYTITGLPVGSGYSVRFFDGASNAIFGTPFNTSPVVAGVQVTRLGNPSTGNNTVTGAVVVGPATPFAASIKDVTLYAGDNVQEQNLPLDPSGVVYDSVTRQPIPGATVRLVYEGAGSFNPATQTLGGSDTVITGTNGFYQFFFQNNPPAGVYRLDVVPPGAYLPPQATQGGVAAAQPTLVAAAGGSTKVQPQDIAPAVGVNGATPVVGFAGGVGTQYFLRLQFNFPGFFEVLNNHIPLDKILNPGALLVSKTGDKTVAELGDSVQYTIRIRNTTLLPISVIKLNDLLPAGFRYILGTARLGGVALANPAGGVGRDLTFDIGTIAGQATAELTYFVRLGVGSQQGDGINRAQTTAPVRSNVALFKVTVQGGVFSNEGCIIGKVYVDCDGNAVQNNSGGSRELGIPGVRLVMLDGTFILTDSEGKYSICGVKPQTHVIKIDRTTLPKGSRMMPSSNRNAGVGDSLFVDLKGGELARADFIEGSCSPEVLDQVKARRAQGGVVSPEVEKKLPLKIENRPVEAAQQILPEARQQDAIPVKPAEAR